MIYLDNAASTPPAPEALEAATDAARQHFGNPSSAHAAGAAAARALEAARGAVAALLRAPANEIVFTSGGTEANALAVMGAAQAARGRHLVVSAIEHPAVLRTAERLAAQGFTLQLVAPGADGVVRADDVVAAARPDTAIVALMLVNNELGTVQPVSEVARGLRAAGLKAHLHVDGVQAAPLLPINVATLGADSLAISGHKLHGPKGIGALWVRGRIQPLWGGGGQERGLRPGTENVPGCVGLGHAATLVRAQAHAGGVGALRDQLEALIFTHVPGARPTVPAGTPRAPHISSITLPGLPAEPLLHALEERHVIASAGSACASRAKGPSHVLQAIGVSERDAVLRFSLSRFSRSEDLPPVAQALAEAAAEVGSVVRSR